MKFQILSDRHVLEPQKPSDRDVLLRVIAPAAPADSEPTPLHLSFALDCSWSMKGKRLQYAKRAIYKALDLLGPNDSATITRFSREAETLIGLTKTDDEGKARIAATLARIETNQGTNLFDGWDLAAEAIKNPNGEISRVLLLSDGIANCGECKLGTIAKWVARASRQGIRTSVFGVGDNYDDDLLQAISAAGQGNFFYAASREQIPEFVAQEVTESRRIVARAVVLSLELPPGAEVVVRGDWVVSTRDRVTSIHLPDLFAEQVTEVGVTLRFPAFADQETVRVGVDLKTEAGPAGSDEIIYAIGATSGETRDPDIFIAVANLRVHQALREAVRLNRGGDEASAGNLFDQLALEFKSQGIDPDDYQDLFELLEKYSARMRRYLQESDRKSISHHSTMSMRSRIKADHGFAKDLYARPLNRNKGN